VLWQRPQPTPQAAMQHLQPARPMGLLLLLLLLLHGLHQP
jgi:hypothetical protein